MPPLPVGVLHRPGYLLRRIVEVKDIQEFRSRLKRREEKEFTPTSRTRSRPASMTVSDPFSHQLLRPLAERARTKKHYEVQGLAVLS